MQSIFPLKGAVQHYAWGGTDFIPELLNLKNTDLKPFAELWLGAHPKGPSLVETKEGQISLKDFIESNSKEYLSAGLIEKFGQNLPFLLKILDVKKMLSIQVHPSKKAAEKGFAAEQEKGVPVDAFNRNFRDTNHKPELMWALTDFWLLHGFRKEEEIETILQSIKEFTGLLEVFRKKKSIAVLYQYIMEMPQSKVNEILEPLKERLASVKAMGLLDKNHPDFWAQRAFEDFTKEGNYDRGVFSIYLLNLVFLKKGEVIFQDSGILHAYLEGVNVELMANSDNVLRGGLTPKYIDVPELMKHLHFESVVPNILTPTSSDGMEWLVKTPAPDFELSAIELTDGQKYSRKVTQSPEIYLILEGKFELKDNLSFSKGEAFFVPAASEFEMTGQGFVFKASVPY
jgi:mannose-6-phosphate isomerase